MKADEREENLPTTVQGRPVGSKEEARVSVALGFLQIPFIYQYEVFGGRDRRGGLILDWLVLTVPMPTPLLLQSTYWHGPARQRGPKDEFAQSKIRRLMPGWADPKEIWDRQVPTVWDAIKVCRQLFGRR